MSYTTHKVKKLDNDTLSMYLSKDGHDWAKYSLIDNSLKINGWVSHSEFNKINKLFIDYKNNYCMGDIYKPRQAKRC